jgi:hypothetical protein
MRNGPTAVMNQTEPGYATVELLRAYTMNIEIIWHLIGTSVRAALGEKKKIIDEIDAKMGMMKDEKNSLEERWRAAYSS